MMCLWYWHFMQLHVFLWAAHLLHVCLRLSVILSMIRSLSLTVSVKIKKVLRDETPESLQTLANESITQTLSRSISTSFTTVVMVLMLLILGVTSIREFALPLLVGIVCGTYSSICIATELWYVMKVHIKGKKRRQTKIGYL